MLNEEMIAKAREAKSVEELITLAKESGWPIEDDELDNVSGGMRPTTQDTVICSRCGHDHGAARNKSVSECPKCGCRWNFDTGEILN